MTDPGDSSLFVMHARDPQEQAASFGMLDQSYEQISAGAFAGSLQALSGGGTTVFHETLNQSVFQMGMSDPGHFTIAVAYDLSERLYWNGRLLDQGAVVAYAPGRDFELRTPQRTACVGLSLPPTALQSIAPDRAPEDWGRFFTHHDGWSGAGQAKANLQARIARLLHGAVAAGAGRAWTSDLIGLREMAIDYLGGVVEQREAGGHRLRVDSYPRIARRARAFMLERMDKPMSVTDICLGLGCSRRSLQYAFESVYGVSPVSYLLNVRLAAARQRLRTAADGATVKSIATQVGFTHLPRFAVAYTRMFGERPSQTLAARR